MKNLTLIKIIMPLLMVVSVANLIQAGQSESIAVSFIIPLVPGLNAPLIEEESRRLETNIYTEDKIQTEEDHLQPTAMLIEQDTQKEPVAVKDSNPPMTVKTYYSR